MDVMALFRSIPRPSVEEPGTVFRVAPMPGVAVHRLGKDASGAPALLLHVARDTEQSPAPIVLKHIAVQHNVQCRLSAQTSADAREEELTLVRCASGEPTLRECFVRASEVAVRQLGASPSHGDVNRVIKQLTELFRAFEQPGQKTVQGLWAELLVIDSSSDPGILIDSWHVDPDEAFDFADGPTRLEVKSFSGPTRMHSFSLRQVRPGLGVEVVIVSVKAERSAGGATVSDLVVRIQGRGLSTERCVKLDLVVARSLGEAAPTGLSLAFDLERGRQSTRHFDAATVPSVDPQLPAGVLNVRFDAVLDDSRALPASALLGRRRLLTASVPRV